MVVVFVVELVEVVGGAMGVVPDELFGFVELAGFEEGFGLVVFDLER